MPIANTSPLHSDRVRSAGDSSFEVQNSSFTQIFEQQTNVVCYSFSLMLHGIPWDFHDQRSAWVFQVCGDAAHSSEMWTMKFALPCASATRHRQKCRVGNDMELATGYNEVYNTRPKRSRPRLQPGWLSAGVKLGRSPAPPPVVGAPLHPNRAKMRSRRYNTAAHQIKLAMIYLANFGNPT